MCFVVRGGSGCLGAASTTNYSDSSCAGAAASLGPLLAAPTSPKTGKGLRLYLYQEAGGGDYPRQQPTTYHTSSGVPGKKVGLENSH